jgi:hypothetical protein
LLHEFLIEVHTIGQDHICQGVLVLVLAVCLERDFFAEGEVRGNLLRLLTECLAFLRAVYPAETDAFGVSAVQDFDGVAVEDGDDGAGGVSCSEII